jgi:hypothetical protein
MARTSYIRWDDNDHHFVQHAEFDLYSSLKQQFAGLNVMCSAVKQQVAGLNAMYSAVKQQFAGLNTMYSAVK